MMLEIRQKCPNAESERLIDDMPEIGNALTALNDSSRGQCKKQFLKKLYKFFCTTGMMTLNDKFSNGPFNKLHHIIQEKET